MMQGIFELECYSTSDAPTKWEPAAHYKPDTNADRIRAMSDEELLQVLGMFVDENLFDLICNNPKRTTVCDSNCVKCISEWLKQPAEVE